MPLEHGTQGRSPTYFNLIIPGTVADRKQDSSGLHIRVTHPDKSGVTSAWLPVLQRETVGTQHAFLPRIGSQVWVLYDPTGVEQGLVIGSTYTTNLPPPTVSSGSDVSLTVYDDGAATQYNPDNSTWNGNTPGPIILHTAGPMTIVSTGNINVTTHGDLDATVSGNLNANVTGTATVTAPTIKLSGNVEITGTCQIDNNLTVNGATTTVQNLTISGVESGGGST